MMDPVVVLIIIIFKARSLDIALTTIQVDD